MVYKHNKHKDNPERNQEKDSKLVNIAQTGSDINISQQLKFGNGSMYFEYMNRQKADESYKTK